MDAFLLGHGVYQRSSKATIKILTIFDLDAHMLL